MARFGWRVVFDSESMNPFLYLFFCLLSSAFFSFSSVKFDWKREKVWVLLLLLLSVLRVSCLSAFMIPLTWHW